MLAQSANVLRPEQFERESAAVCERRRGRDYPQCSEKAAPDEDYLVLSLMGALVNTTRFLCSLPIVLCAVCNKVCFKR